MFGLGLMIGIGGTGGGGSFVFWSDPFWTRSNFWGIAS